MSWNQRSIQRQPWDPSRFRQTHMTRWPRSQVLLPPLRTDHWTKMKTMVPGFMTSMPSAFLKATAEGDTNTLPSLTDRDYEPEILLSHYQTRANSSPYRNVYNDRARLGFCYWPTEKKPPTRKGYSFGAYKTYLGLPRV